MQGWIKLHRKLMDNPIWADPNYVKLWMYCLMKAAHKASEQVMIGHQVIDLERGQFVTGRDSLASEMNRGVKPSLKLSAVSWWRHLKNLEKWGMLHIKSFSKFSIITVDKYELYQSGDQQSDQQSDQEVISNCSSNDQQVITNKNVKNDKNDKNDQEEEAAAAVNWYDRFIESFNRMPNAIQIDQVSAFLDDGVEVELLIHAFEKAAMKNASFNYAQAILTEWVKKGIKTIEQGKAESEKFNVIKGGKKIRQENLPEWFDKHKQEREGIIQDQEVDQENVLDMVKLKAEIQPHNLTAEEIALLRQHDIQITN